jgi:hypothetical protein
LPVFPYGHAGGRRGELRFIKAFSFRVYGLW